MHISMCMRYQFRLQVLSETQVVAEQKLWEEKLEQQKRDHLQVLKDHGLLTLDAEAGVQAVVCKHFVQLTDAFAGTIAQYISEKLVSAACPKCFHYVPGFDACCALECTVPTCNTPFCAWCLQPCVDLQACHDHVLRCPMNPRKLVFLFTL